VLAQIAHSEQEHPMALTNTPTRVTRSATMRPTAAVTATRTAATVRTATVRTWKKDPDMATTTKPEPPVEDEREQARRALQTSMDTRQ
jgi:hypothetical protein